jgi:hypothetical protein
MVARDLLLKGTLPFLQVIQCLAHVVHLGFALHSLAVLAPDVTGDGVENPLIAIRASYLASLLKLQQVLNRPSLDLAERQSANTVSGKAKAETRVHTFGYLLDDTQSPGLPGKASASFGAYDQ